MTHGTVFRVCSEMSEQRPRKKLRQPKDRAFAVCDALFDDSHLIVLVSEKCGQAKQLN